MELIKRLLLKIFAAFLEMLLVACNLVTYGAIALLIIRIFGFSVHLSDIEIVISRYDKAQSSQPRDRQPLKTSKYI